MDAPYSRTAFGLLETERHVGDIGLCPNNKGIYTIFSALPSAFASARCPTLLLLVAIVLGYLGLEEDAVGVVFRLDVYPMLVLYIIRR